MEQRYSVPVGAKRPGESHVYRSPDAAEGLLRPPAEMVSMQDVWRQSVKNNLKRKCLDDYTYRQVDEWTRYLGSWLWDNSFKVLYIHSINRWEWTLLDISCFKYGIVSVPLYDTLGKEALEHTLQITQGNVTAVSQAALNSLLKADPPSLKNITHIILLDEIAPETMDILTGRGIKFFSLKQILNRKLTKPYPLILPDDPLSYIFTSGTTGQPKGVVISHANVIHVLYALEKTMPFTNEDVHLSYLPLQHAFERLWMYILLRSGANARFYSGSVAELLKDLQRVKPTVLPIVPRLLNMFYAMMGTLPWVDRQMAEAAWSQKVTNWEKGISTSDYEDKVFSRVRNTLGGRIRLMITGSAPISTEVLKFFMVSLGCDVREGFGQTQTTGAAFLTRKGEQRAGHVGGVLSSVEFKLVDIPEMNYTSNGDTPRGEICLRGASIFSLYYRDKVSTEETIDKQGWHHTGDVGQLEPDGAMRIIDRKKNIFKLSQAEYVAPEKIENVYLRCPLISECFIYGDSLQSFLVAIVVPNKDVLTKAAAGMDINKSFEQLCQDARVKKLIHDKLLEQGKQGGLVGFEQAKRICLRSDSFAVQGLYTNTMKLQRHLAKKAFEREISAMYASK